jgi:adenosylcobinamide kinase/adenosylcobinamide-phosphate guanylyltransferase
LVLVSPEVGLSVVPATAAGRVFADWLGTVNREIAARCDGVVLVVAGNAVAVKGRL